MITFKSHSTHCPTREKITTCNLTGNLCEKHVTQLGIEPRTLLELTVPKLDHSAIRSNSHPKAHMFFT